MGIVLMLIIAVCVIEACLKEVLKNPAHKLILSLLCLIFYIAAIIIILFISFK